MALYEEFLTRFRWEGKHVSDMVPWRAGAAPGVMLCKPQHALLRTYAVRGLDMQGETKEAQGARLLQANNALKRLGGEWQIQSEAQRCSLTEYPQSDWPSPVATLVDHDRQRTMLHTPGSRETRYFLSLIWTPPLGTLTGTGQQLTQFIHQADYFLSLLRGLLATFTPCSTADLWTYLHTCVSDRWHAVARPYSLLDADAQLCDTAFADVPPPEVHWWQWGFQRYAGQLTLGDWHVRICSLTGYPGISYADMMRELEALDLDFRWCTRWSGLERYAQSGVLRKQQKAWRDTEKSIWVRMTEYPTGQEVQDINVDAAYKAQQMDSARLEIGSDIVAYGNFTTTVMVWDCDAKAADDKLRAVMQAFEARGFTMRKETRHATAAWLSMLPGNKRDNVRRTPQHSLALAHLTPGLIAAWRGPLEDAYLHGPPWFLAHTETSTAFRVSNHVQDVGHTLILGPTGAGKTTLEAFLHVMWRKYQGPTGEWSQNIAFDLDGGLRLMTLMQGGHWYDLASGQLAFQPLRHIDDPLTRAWAVTWVLDRVRESGTVPSAEMQLFVGSTLARLAQQPPAQRTISTLLTVMAEQSSETNRRASAGRVDAQGISRPDTRLEALVSEQHLVRVVLKHYSREGEYGWLLDSDQDALQEGPVHTFELRTLLTLPRVAPAVLDYVFHTFETRLFSTERPTLLTIGDAALPLAIPRFQDKAREYMMTLRKKSVSLCFSTHSLSQVFSSPLGPMLLESCPTRFLLPNPAAKAPQLAKIYADLGLVEEEITQIATAQPQQQVYYSCELLGKRLFSLGLSPFLLDCLARNSVSDHQLMDTLLAREGREGFAAAWFKEKGHAEASEFCQQWYGAQKGERGCETSAENTGE
jgi:type IV secretion system protein VirB4